MMATNDSEPTVFLQKFIAADVATGVILGSDFLSKNNTVVSFADRACVIVWYSVVVYLNDSLEALGAYQEGFVLQKYIYIYIYIY